MILVCELSLLLVLPDADDADDADDEDDEDDDALAGARPPR